jgi:hypothetical protein
MWLVMEEQPHCHAVRAEVVPREREKERWLREMFLAV